jgi:hypothetical protein
MQKRKSKEARKLADDLESHARDNSGRLRDWYAGVTEDWEQRLFDGHNVSRKQGEYKVREASSEKIARSTEDKLHARGFQGSHGGGDESSQKFVYVYRTRNRTEE